MYSVYIVQYIINTFTFATTLTLLFLEFENDIVAV